MLPGIGFWCLMLVSAGAADRLQAYGVLTTRTTRRIMQSIGKSTLSTTVHNLINIQLDVTGGDQLGRVI